MLLIVKYEPCIIDTISKLLGYTPAYYTFDEKFKEFVRTIPKKNKNLATKEIFSLSYDSLLSDLKKSIWVSVDEKEFPLIENKLNILEVCN